MAPSKSQSVVTMRETNEDYTETSPLITPPRDTSEHQGVEPASHRRISAQRLLWIVISGIFLASLGDQLMESPQTRIFEAIICYKHYEQTDPSKLLAGREAVGPGAIGGVDEAWCKTAVVQNKLAALRGWQLLFNGIPALLFAIPVGWAADRFGRKPLLILGIAAYVLRSTWIQLITWFWQAFDLRLTWFSTIFMSIGGGETATSSIVFVAISDITSDADRASAFFRVTAFNLAASLLMPPVAAALMEVNPWIPSLLGTALEGLSIIIFFLVPETLHWQAPPSPGPASVTPVVNRLDAEFIGSDVAPVERYAPKSGISRIRQSMAFLTHDWRIMALIAPFTILFIISSLAQLLLQYVSARYDIRLSKAILITTIRMGVVVSVLFLLLPWISKLMTGRLGLSAQRKDLYLTRASLISQAIGWTLTGLSPNLPVVIVSFVISSLGEGGSLLARSFLTSLVEKDHIARVYSLISIIETLGSMASAPLMAYLFKRSLGLPFCFLGVASACSAVLMFIVGLRKGEDRDTSVEAAQEPRSTIE